MPGPPRCRRTGWERRAPPSFPPGPGPRGATSKLQLAGRVITNFPDVTHRKPQAAACHQRRRHLPTGLHGQPHHPLLTPQGRELVDRQYRVRSVQTEADYIHFGVRQLYLRNAAWQILYHRSSATVLSPSVIMGYFSRYRGIGSSGHAARAMSEGPRLSLLCCAPIQKG